MTHKESSFMDEHYLSTAPHEKYTFRLVSEYNGHATDQITVTAGKDESA
jgi:hypothetical protein